MQPAHGMAHRTHVTERGKPHFCRDGVPAVSQFITTCNVPSSCQNRGVSARPLFTFAMLGATRVDAIVLPRVDDGLESDGQVLRA